MNNKALEEKIKHPVHSIVFEKGFVCPVDILLRLGYLSLNDYESWTDYRKHGKGAKIKLHFSKSGDKNIEEFYATHFVDIKKDK